MWVETKMTKKRAAKSEEARKAMMQPQDVAQKVLDQIFSCSGGQIILPANGTWLTAIHGFPNWLQELLRDLAAKRR
jgi:short-subunit dehydrogenase